MKNEYWHGKKKEHQWDYMGVDVETHAEYAMCNLCGKYKKISATSKIITKSQYQKRMQEDKIVFK